MSLSLRRRYLKEWTSYPAFTDGVGVRVESVTDCEMVIKFQGQYVKVLDEGAIRVEAHAGQHWETLDLKSLTELFSPGDWLVLAVKPHASEVTLEELVSVRLAAPNTMNQALAQRPFAQQFSLFIEDVRHWFLKSHFSPANTPSLVTCPGMEPPLVPFQVLAESGRPAFLPTSPELHLKKMLCRGYENIFEIKRVFRREVVTSQHQPEFLMLEWYRSFSNLRELREDLKSLVEFLSLKGWNRMGYQKDEWSCLTVRELFKEHLDFELRHDTRHEELLQLAREREVGFQCPGDSWDDTFFKIFLSCLEDKLKSHGLATLQDYPPTQAALARLNDSGWAERMEFYISGLEVGNAFDELNDPDIQHQRFLKDQKERRQRGLVDVPLDDEFLNHLKLGMPPTAGIAIGLERLFMGLMGIGEISELLEFPAASQED